MKEIESIKLSLDSPLVDEANELSGEEILSMISAGAAFVQPDRWTEVCNVMKDVVCDIAQQVTDEAQDPIEQITMMLMLAENCIVNALGYMDMLEMRTEIARLERGETDA